MKTAPVRGGAFFRTMVLMGSSVALGCGGSTQDGGSGGAPGSGSASGAGGSDGTGGTTGGGPATGGGSNSGSGGFITPPGTGGAAGGSLNLGGFGGAYPTDCPTTQLSCLQPNSYACYPEPWDGFLSLPADCVCDPEQPASPEDCEADERFVCQGASVSAAGETFDEVVPFNCACVPANQYDGCYSVCADHPNSPGSVQCTDPGEISPDLDAYLCGCALTILK